MQLIVLSLASLASAMLMPSSPVNQYQDPCSGVLGYMYAFGNSTCPTLPSYMWPTCKCPDYRYAQSVVQCIYQMVTEVYEVPEQAQNQTLQGAYSAFIAACPQYTMTDVASYRANSSSLAFYDQNTTNFQPGYWPVNGAFKLGTKELKNAAKASYYYSTSETRNKRYGAGLLGFWAGILLLKGANLAFGKLFPLFTMRICHLIPVRFYRGEVAIRNSSFLNDAGVSRVHALIIAAFSILVILFSFCDLPISFPNYMFLNSRRQMWGNYIGQRTGVLSLYVMPLLLLFAGRNNFLQIATGWPLGPFLLFHKWVARAVVFLLAVHTIAYSIQRSSSGSYSSQWGQAYWTWGIVGFAFACFLFVQGMRYLRARAYDVFVALHIVGVVFFLVGGYLHLAKNDEPYGLYFYYASFAVWGLDRAVRFLKILASGVCKVADIRFFDNVLVFVIDRPKHWNLLEHPGKYMFIHIWKPSLFWQSHPFTVTVNPDNHNQLKLFCRVHRGATKKVADMVLSEHSSIVRVDEKPEKFGFSGEYLVNAPSLNLPVLLDGPYGHSFDFLEFDECIFVAGGTGVTAPFSYIQSILHKYPNSNQKLSLFWAVRSGDASETWFENELRFLRSYPTRVQVNIFCSTKGNKLNIPELFESAIVRSPGPVAVMCCGPSAMCLSTRHAVADAMRNTDKYVDYFEELFNW